MVANVLKYKSDNLIILYYYTYIEFGSWIDKWLEYNLYQKRVRRVQISDGIWYKYQEILTIL